MNLGDVIRIARKKQGMSQGVLARLADIESQTISNIETGVTKTLKSANLRRLADALKLPIETLTMVNDQMLENEPRQAPTLPESLWKSLEIIAKYQGFDSIADFLEEEVVVEYAPPPTGPTLAKAALPKGEMERHEREVELKTKKKNGK